MTTFLIWAYRILFLACLGHMIAIAFFGYVPPLALVAMWAVWALALAAASREDQLEKERDGA